MAGPIPVATALATRLVMISCPHCGNSRLALRRPGAWCVCLRCRRKYNDPADAQ